MAITGRDSFPVPNGLSQISGTRASHICFVLIGLTSLVVFRAPLSSLIHLALHDERYSYIAFVPFLSAALIYLERASILQGSSPMRLVGGGLMAIGFVFRWILSANILATGSGRLPLSVMALLLVWLGGLLFCYGIAARRVALVPLIFLVLTIPPPPDALDKIALWLQQGSADASYLFFKAAGVPILRQGFLFSLPGLDIEVARQCSGIRSGISLFLAALLAGHLVLQSTWRQFCLCLLTLPIVIAKNALRIVVLSLLGAYVDRDILFGRIHQNSGLLFSPLALLVLAWILVLFYRSEKKAGETNTPRPGPGKVQKISVSEDYHEECRPETGT